jgi:hypothetical protein
MTEMAGRRRGTRGGFLTEKKKRREMGAAARDGKEEGALGFQVALRERGGAGEVGR